MKAVDALKEVIETAGIGTLEALAEVSRDALKKAVLDLAARPDGARYTLYEVLREIDTLRNILTLQHRCEKDDAWEEGQALVKKRDEVTTRAQTWITGPAHCWISLMNGALAGGRAAGQAAAVADEALAEYEKRFGKATP